MSKLGDLLRAATSAPQAETPVADAEPTTWYPTDSGPVDWSPDLERIVALPRRPAIITPDDPLVMEQTLLYRRPGGTMVLRPLQARALAEAVRCGGLMAALGVGEGKTLLAFLLATALDARVTVMLVPAALVAQVHAMHAAYAREWFLPSLGNTFSPGSKGVVHVVSYSQLSSVRGADSLEGINADLVVADEVHLVRRTSAARTKRFFRWFTKNPNRKLCGLSGTIVAKSIRDPWRLAKQALGNGSPFPHAYPVVESWAGALDPSDFPTDPGALSTFAGPGESVRSGFGRRVNETPGFVVSDQNAIAASLTIHERPVVTPKVVTDALEKMRAESCTPGGEEFREALDAWRYGQQLASGLYYRWIWPRNEPLEVRKTWLAARKEWHREIRNYLAHSARPGLDSPLLLARAAASGKWDSLHFARWQEVHKTARPQTEAVWVSDFLVTDAVSWGINTKGVIWYEIDALGRAIAKAGGFPFYGPGPQAAADLLKEDGSRTVVASRRAHGEGKNLQVFREHLVTTPSSSGKTWEQLLGRSHRTGQTEDVAFYTYRHTPELKDAIAGARKDAAFIQDVLKARQKLTYCNITF